MASVYRERDRYDDSRSVASTRRDDGERVTRVTRYIIREDDDNRSSHTHASHQRRPSPERERERERERETITISRRGDSPDRERETIRITRRDVDDRDTVASPRRSVAPVYVEKDLSIRGREEDTRSQRAWERTEDTTDRELVVRRSEDYDDGRRETDRESVAVVKSEDRRDVRGYDYDAYRTGEYGRDRDLQHYTRTAEYYGPQAPPQTIIIRQDPIIIRERIRDDDYQMVKKSDVDEERSVARSAATTRRNEPRDEEYFYEKKVRERFDDDEFDRRRGREISPHDSISQVGRERDRSYDSDDSIVYVKRVKEERYSREHSRDDKKDLAAGVIAGVGAAELLRNHRKKEGKEASSGIGRVGQDLGAGAIGAIAAEGIRRYRSKSRHGSRERARSESRERYGRSRSRRGGRSRSRSESRPSLKTLGALGLGAAAVAAAATLASRKMNENKAKEARRSRSRRRRSGDNVESLAELENDRKASDARNPQHRTSRIAAAGAVGAAGAALLERARSKSRGGSGSRERSRSKVRQGLPIVAAGLGTAALAGLYETQKAKREAEGVQQQQKKEAREARSRSASRRDNRSDAYYDDRPRNSDPDWGVEYGHGDVAGSNFGPEYYGRAPPQEPYYGAGAIVPAEERRSRSRSLSRDRRGQRSSSRGGGVGDAALGAGAGAAAASEHERKKAEKRERKARKREQEAQEAGRDPYEDSYGSQQAPPAPWTPPPPNETYGGQQGFGNQYQSQYPPPPGSMPSGLPNQFQPQYQTAPAATPQPGPGPYTPQNAYTPQPAYHPQAYPPPGMQTPQPGYNQQYRPEGANQYAPPPMNRGTSDEHVSAGHSLPPYAPPTNDQRPSDGVNTSRSLGPTPVPPMAPMPPLPTGPTPAIHIQSPTNASTRSLDIPRSYVPPAERPDSPPNDEGNARHVQFASSPDTPRAAPAQDANGYLRSDAANAENISSDARRQRRRRHDSNRGYEASDDTDLSPNSERRASKNREQSNERGVDKNGSRRERSSNRQLSSDDNDPGRRRSSDARRDRRSSRSDGAHDQPRSPDDEDSVVDLPPRFDAKGRKIPERGDDPFGDKIDDILKGKGTAGKVFGNFMDGLFGPNGKKSGGGAVDDGGEGSGRRKRDKDRDRE